MPVRSGNDRLASAQGIGQSSRYCLRHMTIWRDVNIGRTHQRRHFQWAGEAVVENHFSLNSHISGQGLQLISVPVPLACSYVRMSGARDDVHSIAVPCDDAWQSLNHVLESLVGRQQAEGEQYF